MTCCCCDQARESPHDFCSPMPSAPPPPSVCFRNHKRQAQRPSNSLALHQIFSPLMPQMNKKKKRKNLSSLNRLKQRVSENQGDTPLALRPGNTHQGEENLADDPRLVPLACLQHTSRVLQPQFRPDHRTIYSLTYAKLSASCLTVFT